MHDGTPAAQATCDIRAVGERERERAIACPRVHGSGYIMKPIAACNESSSLVYVGTPLGALGCWSATTEKRENRRAVDSAATKNACECSFCVHCVHEKKKARGIS